VNARQQPECERSVSRLAWAALLQRVFAVDVLECPRCGGRMRLLATIHPPAAAEAILECLGAAITRTTDGSSAARGRARGELGAGLRRRCLTQNRGDWEKVLATSTAGIAKMGRGGPGARLRRARPTNRGEQSRAAGPA
jgi:hypothetical protein